MFFYRQLEQYGDRTALITAEGRKISYNELVKAADSFSSAISERCLIFLLCGNCAESIVGYTACMRSSAVAVMLSSDIDIQMLLNLTDNYMPSYIWLPEEKADGLQGTAVFRYEGYTLLRTNAKADYEINPELKLLMTTSGSTGSPKFVRQTEKNIQSNTESIAEYLSIQKDDRAITTMPMNYTYGLSIINSHFFMGAAIILNPYTLMDKKFWELMNEQQATTFGGVPYIYEMLKKLRFERMNIPSLRYLTQAGGALSSELSDEFSNICRERGIKFIVMYGQTEATARMSYRPWESAFTKAGSIGVAIPGGKFALIDENGEEISGANVVGELIYRGDNVTLGYAQSVADLSKGDENNGVLITGDMAKRDSDGFYYIVGRKKRFLKLFGNRVNLDEVELLIKKLGIECACSGTDDKMSIYITSCDKKDEVIDFINHHTAISHGGYTVKIIDKIPRNESGKILYSELK